MTTSVALCTFNGERFLREQIDSIINQTISVDEIIVCDDGSQDKTVEILEDYAIKFPNIFKIFINEKNLRSVKNFEKAISLCTKDIIFLSDQDDVWEDNKVEIFKRYFKNNPDIDVICSDGIVIDSKGIPLNKFTIWGLPKLLKERNIEINYFNIIAFVENIATGAGMGFRRKIVQSIIPFPLKNGFHHDEWIALIASHMRNFTIIEEKLFQYRIHENQQVGGVFYENDTKNLSRLANHFNIFSEEKTFSQYKKFLKRISESYKKHKTLIEENENLEISEEIAEKSKELFIVHKNNMKKKFPLKFLFLSISDSFNKKRRLK